MRTLSFAILAAFLFPAFGWSQTVTHRLLGPWGGGSFTKVGGTNGHLLFTSCDFIDGSGSGPIILPGPLTGLSSVSSQRNATTVTALSTMTTLSASKAFRFTLGSYVGTIYTPQLVWFSNPSSGPGSVNTPPKVYKPDPDQVGNPGGYVDSDGQRVKPDGEPLTYTNSTILDSSATLVRVWTWTAVAVSGGTVLQNGTQTLAPGAPDYTLTVGPLNENFTITKTFADLPNDTDNDGLKDDVDPYPEDAGNNGWGDRVMNDDDGDGVKNWDDEYPSDPTRGTAGPDGGGTSSNPGQAKFSKTIELDNTTGTSTAKFYVTVFSVPSAEFPTVRVLSQQVIEVPAGMKSPLTITADEAFTFDVTKELISGVTLEGEPDLTREVIAKNARSNQNSEGENKGAPKVTQGEAVTPPSTNTPSDVPFEVQEVGNEIKKVNDSVRQGTRSLLAKLDQLFGDSSTGQDPDPDGPDASGMLGAIRASGEGLITAVGNLRNSLFASVTGSTSLNFAIPTVLFGNLTVHLEDYATYFGLIRSVFLWVMAVAFLQRVYLIIQYALS
jgi:hypothetical protein